MRVAEIAALAVTLALPDALGSPPELGFHHLHLRDVSPAFRIDFYERLFMAADFKRVRFAGTDGFQTGLRMILVSPALPRTSGTEVVLGTEVGLGDGGRPGTEVASGIDHVAFTVTDIDQALVWLRQHEVEVTKEPAVAGEVRVAMIEGPDRIAIELVERQP